MSILQQHFAPTPLYLLETDEQSNRIFIKREDLLPYCFGGNKVRIALEYMRDMQAKGCNHMVAYGNPRSNLCRVLSNLCAGLGTPLTILSPADGDGLRPSSFNGQLCEALGARIIPCQKDTVAETVDRTMASIQKQGETPYYIYGNRLGTGHKAVPIAAYARMYREIATQEESMQAAFDAVFLATGTGMTQAGLLCGQALAGEAARHWPILGLSIARTGIEASSHIQAYIQAYWDSQGKAPPTGPIKVHDDFRDQYGKSGPAVQACIHKAFALHGLPLDETYTGKAFFGMQQLLRQWGWQGRDLLFLHTGGTPLFFDGLEAWMQP